MLLREFYVNMQCIVFSLVQLFLFFPILDTSHDPSILLCLGGNLVQFKSHSRIPIHLLPWANVNQILYRNVKSIPQWSIPTKCCSWGCWHPDNLYKQWLDLSAPSGIKRGLSNNSLGQRTQGVPHPCSAEQANSWNNLGRICKMVSFG